MKRAPKFAWLFMTLALLFLSACGSGNATAPTVDTAFIFTQVASTAWAYQTETVLAVPTATATPLATSTLEATNTPPATDTPIPSSTPTATVYVVPATAEISAGPIPSMNVTLMANDTYTNAATVPTGSVLIFRAEVQNNSSIPLQVVANLSVPEGWGVSENPYSDCPTTEDLNLNDTCTITWKFNPKVSGQVILRVYVKGFYTDTAGNSQRITDSPAFIFNVQ